MARITEQELLEAASEITFGIEIETAYVEPSDLSYRMARHLTDAGHTATANSYSVTVDGKRFDCKYDGSISPYGTEIVSPILTLADVPLLQDVVRAARKAGAKTHASCGVHIHIGVADWTVKQIINLAKIVNKQEDLIYAALGTSASRRRAGSGWCRPVRQEFIDKINGRRAPRTREALATAWYTAHGYTADGYTMRHHYNDTRYHGLNLHSVFYRGTAEFRYFESSLHAGQIKTWIQLVLAIAVRAKRARAASAAKRTLDRSRVVYDVRVFCLDLGLSGDTFKTARRFLFGDKSPIAGRGSYSRRQRRTVRRAA